MNEDHKGSLMIVCVCVFVFLITTGTAFLGFWLSLQSQSQKDTNGKDPSHLELYPEEGKHWLKSIMSDFTTNRILLVAFIM